MLRRAPNEELGRNGLPVRRELGPGTIDAVGRTDDERIRLLLGPECVDANDEITLVGRGREKRRDPDG